MKWARASHLTITDFDETLYAESYVSQTKFCKNFDPSRHVERMDKYCMARRVLMAGTRETEVRLDGWCGSLGQQRNDGGGCASMRKRSERPESPSTFVTE